MDYRFKKHLLADLGEKKILSIADFDPKFIFDGSKGLILVLANHDREPQIFFLITTKCYTSQLK